MSNPRGVTHFRNFTKTYRNVEFEGGLPDDRWNCHEHATLKLQKLEDECWKDLCAETALGAAHVLQEARHKGDKILPLLLGLTDVYIKLGSRPPVVRLIDDDQQAAVQHVGRKRHSPEGSMSQDEIDRPQQQQTVPLQGHDQQQQTSQPPHNQQQQNPVLQPASAAKGNTKRVSFCVSSNSDTVDSLLSTRLAAEHDHSIGLWRGPIQLNYTNDTRKVLMVIQARPHLENDHFGTFMAHVCRELISVSMMNAHQHKSTGEVFGWLTDAEVWVGISFQLSKVPDKDSPIRDVHGTFKFTGVMSMMYSTHTTGYCFADDCPLIMSEMARRLLPDRLPLHDIPERLATYQQQINSRAAHMINNLALVKIEGCDAAAQQLPRKRARTEDSATVLTPDDYKVYAAAADAVWDLAEAHYANAEARFITAATAVVELHKHYNCDAVAACNIVDNLRFIREARRQEKAVDLAAVRSVLTGVQKMVTQGLA